MEKRFCIFRNAPKDAPSFEASFSAAWSPMCACPFRIIALPPSQAPRRKGGWLGHFAVSDTASDCRFAKTSGSDHVVQAEEASAGTGDTETLALGQRAAVPLWRGRCHQCGTPFLELSAASPAGSSAKHALQRSTLIQRHGPECPTQGSFSLHEQTLQRRGASRPSTDNDTRTPMSNCITWWSTTIVLNVAGIVSLSI